MPKEFFHYPETASLFTRLEEASQRSSVSRGQAFEDFLTMSVAALSGGRMEDLYLQTVAKHTTGKPGQRGCDTLAKLFGELVAAMEQDTREGIKDILGDLFEGAISYGEHQQYLTPMPVCEMIARLTIGEQKPADEGEPPTHDTAGEPTEIEQKIPTEFPDSNRVKRSVYDGCCGSGRMLLAAAQINRHWEFVGQDIDARCTKMCALNLAFRNLYGFALWGNTLALEKKLVYRTGFDGRGFLREVPLDACPIPVQQAVRESVNPSNATPTNEPLPDDDSATGKNQLRLF